MKYLFSLKVISNVHFLVNNPLFFFFLNSTFLDFQLFGSFVFKMAGKLLNIFTYAN